MDSSDRVHCECGLRLTFPDSDPCEQMSRKEETVGSREIKVLTRSVGGKVHLPEQAGLIRTESTLESDFA